MLSNRKSAALQQREPQPVPRQPPHPPPPQSLQAGPGTGCSGKIVFLFTIHCNPSLAYIAVRDLQRDQCNASVQPLLLAANFLYNQ